MTTTYGHLFLKSMNLFEVQEAYIKHGTTLEVHAAGDNLIGRQIQERAADTLVSPAETINRRRILGSSKEMVG